MIKKNNTWATAFAKQALSDLDIRDLLASRNAAKCHRLHYLQMAAEKLCKAYLLKGHPVNSRNIKTHAVIKRHLRIIARQYGREQLAVFAEEIENLAPACQAGGHREDNTEYPWATADGMIVAPCEWSFPNIDDSDRKIVQLIKLIRQAAESVL